MAETDCCLLEGERTMDAIYSNYAPTFLYVDKYRFAESWIYRESRIPYCMLRYICSGRAKFIVDGKEYIVKENDVFYIPQGSTLACSALEKIVFISVRFVDSIQIPGEDMLLKLWNIRQQYYCGAGTEMREWFEKMYQSAISRAMYKRLETRGYLNLICAGLARRSGASEEPEETVQSERITMESMINMKYIRKRVLASQKDTDPRVQMVVDYITLHPEENLTREKLCTMTGVSESTLRRLFKAEMGKSIYEFTKDTKMMYAAHLLMTTMESISEIGYRLGYESPSYFTRRFRENFGVSPQTYRKNSREA